MPITQSTLEKGQLTLDLTGVTHDFTKRHQATGPDTQQADSLS